MMYDELIKDLRENHDKYFARDMEASNVIEELEKEVQNWKITAGEEASGLEHWFENYQKYVPQWIPVTEQLPKKDVPVFVYLFGDVPYIAWINSEGEWETEQFTIDYDCLPKAWMPLPEPPKEE